MKTLLVGALAGLAATALAGPEDHLFARFVTSEQKKREKRVRAGSAHEMAGPILARRLLHHEPSDRQRLVSKLLFSAAYGIGWGLIHASVRRRLPKLATAVGVPVGAAAFFLFCDGFMAPTLKLSPGLPKLPWQINAKELANHLVWTATVEAAQRLAR